MTNNKKQANVSKEAQALVTSESKHGPPQA
jgi:hypothetical protein